MDDTTFSTRNAVSTVFSVECPSRPILDQIADKWSMMAMAVLAGPTRFNQLKRQLEGVTQRVLTHTLRRLERNGMIERRVLPTSPVGVEYALTPLGESLRKPFSALYDWTVDHTAEIRAAQADYDAGTPPGPESRASDPCAPSSSRSEHRASSTSQRGDDSDFSAQLRAADRVGDVRFGPVGRRRRRRGPGLPSLMPVTSSATLARNGCVLRNHLEVES